MAEHYEHPTFSFGELTARDIIKERWGVVVPEFISDEEIITAGLLELDIVPKEGVSFNNVILEYFYGQVFTSPVFPINRIVEILQSFEPERWSANTNNKLINKIYLQQLNLWKQKAKDFSQRKVIELIEEDLLSLNIDLMKYKILRHYKNIGWKLLDEKFQLFSSLNFNLRDLIVEEDTVTDVIKHVEYYLNDLPMPKDNEEFLNFLENISGLLLIEYERVNDIFKKNPDLITKENIQHVSRTFIQIKDRISPSLSLLENILDHQNPQAP